MVDNSSTFGSSFGGQSGANLSAHVSQLIDDCLRATSIDTSNTLYRERAVTFVNYTYLHLLQGKQWSFTNREQSFELTRPYELGTVGLTQDSDIIEEDLVGDASPVIQWSSGVIDQLFVPDATDGGEAYRIVEHLSTKKVKLAADYTGASTDGASYKIIFDRYHLTAHVQEIKSIMIHGTGEVRLVGLGEFRAKKEQNAPHTGTPRWATIVEIEEDSGQIQIELYPAPEKRYTATIEYSERPVRLEDSETSFPMIPPEHMPALFYGVVSQIYQFQNNAAMAREVGLKAVVAYNKMAGDHKITDPNARIQNGRSYFRKGSRRHRGYYGTKWFGKVDD